MNPTGSGLYIFERGREVGAVQVWPTVVGADLPAVSEAREYVFELREVADVWNAELLVDDVPAEALRPRDPHTARWAWNPGFYAGGVDVAIRSRGAPTVRFEMVTDPDARKLTRENFDTMVREVLEDTFALFALSSHRFGVGRGTGQSPPIGRLEFLRSRLTDLERVVHRINDRPIRVLSVDQQWIPLHKARTISARLVPILSVLTRPGRAW